MNEVLTPAEMREADRLAAEDGGSFRLMLEAGAAVASAVLGRYPDAQRVHVLCGPGNNGGDGYVAARLLRETGCLVLLWRDRPPHPDGDAERAASECPVSPRPISGFRATAGDVVVDALYGAGLSKPIAGAEAQAIAHVAEVGCPVLAVDLPSGLDGVSGRPTGPVLAASSTITFFRRKPGHLLQPGRALCGDVDLREIGLASSVLAAIGCRTWENTPALWRNALPHPRTEAHKYSRGHVAVFSGGPGSTGAARLSAMAAARAGAGAVTVLSPADAMAVNAAHLTAIMLRQVDGPGDILEPGRVRPGGAFVLGPGFGIGERTREFTTAVLRPGEDGAEGVVLDADAITSFAGEPRTLFDASARQGAPLLVLTPHEGEFRRLFADIADDAALSKLERARAASARANAVVVYKGPDTVIAAPDGRAAINANGTPWLATAGSGDVLAGLLAGLLGQRMPAFEAACAAVWIHAEAAVRLGPGLIAEDLPAAVPAVLRDLYGRRPGKRARDALRRA